MKYPYQHERRGDAIRYLPLVPVTIHGVGDSVEIDALIDSGAEDSVLRSDVAEDLGLDLSDGHEVMIHGYDGQEATAWRLLVEFELGNEHWQAPVIFADTVTRQGLLGQISFFAFFTVTFNYRDRVMDIRRQA